MDLIKTELTWTEYTTMLSALYAVKGMVDSEKIDALYDKLYMQMNATKIQEKF